MNPPDSGHHLRDEVHGAQNSSASGRHARGPERPSTLNPQPSTDSSGHHLRDEVLGEHSSQPSSARKRHAAFEPIALVLLSLATVGTAWCSYQAAVWGAVSQRTMNLSAAASRRAVTAELQSYQMALLDVLLFTQHINAHTASNENLARFYSDRFRNEARTAFNAWMATSPFENPNAPPHPFVTNLYQPRLLAEAALAEDESQRLWQQAGEAGRNGRSYVLVTVLLASALFCGGTASKFETPWMHRAVLALGLTAFIFAAIRLFLLPMRL